jgi:hypothetical protein
MKKMILLVLAFCFLTLIGMAVAQSNATSGNQSMTVLMQDSGTNLSEMNLSLYSAATDWGIDAFGVGEAVKFTAPKPDWNLKQIRIAGWNGFNGTEKKVPTPNDFLIEIRDEKLNVLYRLADTQNAYFTFSAPVLRAIDIPVLKVNGNFYVVFYDRGAMVIEMETKNATGNSYFYDSLNNELIPAQFTNEMNTSTKVNWIIRAVGE